jgi:hypothetical protein
VANRRSAIPPPVAARVLFLSDHTCCVCNEKGKPVQIHHIDDNPNHHEQENFAVLCLDDHNRTQVRGGFGRPLGRLEVTRYRDDWLRRVILRREHADELAALRMAGGPQIPTTEEEAEALSISADQALVDYVEQLPEVLVQACSRSRPLWESGSPVDSVRGTYDVIDVVREVLVHLASWYPKDHFGDQPPAEYFSQFVAARFEWHRAVLEPHGRGGTIVGPIAAANVLADLQRAVVDLVSALLDFTQGFALKKWKHRWEDATE